MHFAHGTNRTIGEPFIDESVAFERHALVAHLRSDFRLPACERQSARLSHGARQWLFTIDVFAQLEPHHARRRMIVIWRADDYSVQRFFGIELPNQVQKPS